MARTRCTSIFVAKVAGYPLGAIVPEPTDYDDTSAAYQLGGAFQYVGGGNLHKNQALHCSDPNAYYQIVITEQRFSINTMSGYAGGLHAILIDGVEVLRRNDFSPAGNNNVKAAYFSPNLPAGPKTVRVQNLDTNAGRGIFLDLIRTTAGSELSMLLNPNFLRPAASGSLSYLNQIGWVASGFAMPGNGTATVTTNSTATLRQAFLVGDNASGYTVYRFEIVITAMNAGVSIPLPNHPQNAVATAPGIYAYIVNVQYYQYIDVTLTCNNALGTTFTRFAIFKP